MAYLCERQAASESEFKTECPLVAMIGWIVCEARDTSYKSSRVRRCLLILRDARLCHAANRASPQL